MIKISKEDCASILEILQQVEKSTLYSPAAFNTVIGPLFQRLSTAEEVKVEEKKEAPKALSK